MKMRKILLTAAIALMFTGCGWLDNQVNKIGLTVTSGDYKVTLFSGGKAVKTWTLKNALIQTETNSDGYWWSTNGKIIRVTGDILIEEI
jgi:hypothetical protein